MQNQTEPNQVFLGIEQCPKELEDLLVFCERESTRYALGMPTIRGPYAYATNGRIAVRRLQNGIDFSVHGYPKIEETFRDFRAELCVYEAKIDLVTCDKCDGKRKTQETECTWCNGSGEEEHDCDCEYCDRICGDECEECDGEGTVKPYDVECDCTEQKANIASDVAFDVSVEISDALSTLTGLKLSQYRIASPIFFTADNGIEGLFMPLARN